ncbi:MAG TPA: hypothetical protein VGW78_04740 [Candidatus Babeliales bacterium]|jgi:hypothetical protein|nr:hypothetical protein [Candidatus Babeliales bacterium]
MDILKYSCILVSVFIFTIGGTPITEQSIVNEKAIAKHLPIIDKASNDARLDYITKTGAYIREYQDRLNVYEKQCISNNSVSYDDASNTDTLPNAWIGRLLNCLVLYQDMERYSKHVHETGNAGPLIAHLKFRGYHAFHIAMEEAVKDAAKK